MIQPKYNKTKAMDLLHSILRNLSQYWMHNTLAYPNFGFIIHEIESAVSSPCCFKLSLMLSCRLDAAVLDLVDDETSGMHAQKTRYHWMKV